MALTVLVGVGCAKTGPPPGYESPSAQAPPRADSGRVAQRPPAPPAATQDPVIAAAPSGAQATPRLDPSEEMTAEELATIPEPVPAGQSAPRSTAPLRDEAPTSPETPSPASGSGAAGRERSEPSPAPDFASESPGAGDDDPGADSGEAAEGAWRVQIFASENRSEADRIAREASRRLDVEAAVEREALLYKVRLGRFASESGAHALRERAVRAGYSGAFRIKTSGG